ncbi:MAG TPA: hypothetical protein VHF90_06210 [Thermoleophilaceae bacterium]|nr:hypothetical protein [Thermoleophilaceae bacterium]
MRSGTRLTAAWLAIAAVAVGVAGCGGSDTGKVASTPPPEPAQPEDFPTAKGKTLRGLLGDVGSSGPVIAASVSEFTPGTNRFGFALFSRAAAQIADAPVVLYVAPVGGGPVSGPIPARYERMEVKPQFESRTVSEDEDAAKSLYVADIELPEPGRYELLGLARLDGRIVAATPSGGALIVRRDGPVPDVGERAPVVDTDTVASANGNLESIDTRKPPSSMHDVNFADVAGRKPTVLLFATAALCQSRVCGPVIDVTEQVKAERGDEVAFVHQEIYVDNQIDKGQRPSVAAYGLPTEPWLFVVGADGRIAARIEGAFSAEELNRAIDVAVGKG